MRAAFLFQSSFEQPIFLKTHLRSPFCLVLICVSCAVELRRLAKDLEGKTEDKDSIVAYLEQADGMTDEDREVVREEERALEQEAAETGKEEKQTIQKDGAGSTGTASVEEKETKGGSKGKEEISLDGLNLSERG